MIKNNPFNLLKTMLKTSYNESDIIDFETKKLNKKSLKVWIMGISCIAVIYLSYALVNALKDIGLEALFLEFFFFISATLIMIETVFLVMNTMYFSNDIENYLALPIPSMKLFFTKFSVMIGIILRNRGFDCNTSTIYLGSKNNCSSCILSINSISFIFNNIIFISYYYNYNDICNESI